MSKFARALLLVLVLAAGVRVGYVAFGKQGPCPNPIVGDIPTECAVGDQLFYNAAANRLAEGDGFVEPFDRSADPAPAADHPPLTAIVLAPVSWVADRPPLEWIDDDTHLTHHRYAMVVLGTALVGLIALLGRRVRGDTVGVVAGVIAAVTPNLWVNDGLVMSETVTGLTVVGAMLLAFAAWDRPTPGRVAALGAACGLAGLARAELVLFVPLLAVPVAWSAGGNRRVVLVALVASGIVVAPWVLYNVARFEEPTTLSTNDGIALAGSNCGPVYSGPAIGLTAITGPDACIDTPHPPGDQSEVAKVYRERAFEYAQDHAGRVPVVLAARVGRTWSLYRPLDMVSFNEGEGRERWVSRLGLVAYYPTLLAAIYGAVLLWKAKDRRTLWVLLVPAICVTIGAMVSYGQTRFRAAAEPSLAILAAVAIVAVFERVRNPSTETPRTPSLAAAHPEADR